MNDQQEQSVWSLIEAEDFQRACEKADMEYLKTQKIFPLRNKIYALLLLKKYSDVIELGEQIIILNKSQSDSEFIFVGIANWILDKKIEAIGQWKKGETTKYSDAAGGIELQVLLYFGSVSLNDAALKQRTTNKIKKLLKSKSAINWPAPLGAYILEDITEDQLLSYVSNVPVLRERQLCQAHFVFAIKALETSNVEKYKISLSKAISLGSSTYLESMYHLAIGELARLP